MELEIVPADVAEIQAAVREAMGALCLAAAQIEDAVKRIVVAGQKLRAKREEIEHGDWMAWLEKNVSEPLGVTYGTARNWIKLAEFADRNGVALDNASTVTQAYKLAGLLPESESSSAGSGKDAGNYLVHITRTERAIRSQMKRPSFPSQEARSLTRSGSNPPGE